MARVDPFQGCPDTMPTEVFFTTVEKIGKDPDLPTEIRNALPDTTDDELVVGLIDT